MTRATNASVVVDTADRGLRLLRSKAGWAVSIFAALGLGLRLITALRPLVALDRLFIPDDTYYTLAIARSLAHGHGPSVDGHQLTNGFQPLLAFLEAPLFYLTDSPDTALRAALILLAVCDGMTTVLIARVAYRLGGAPAAVVAAGAWALSPVAIGNALGGLEAALAVLFEVALVDAWLTARRRSTPGRWALVGALAGLAVLARVDALALVGLLAAAQLARGGWRPALPAGMAGVVVLAPWWGYSWLTFGSPVPESGAAVRELVGLHAFPLGARLSWTAGTVTGFPFVLSKHLRTWLFEHRDVGVGLFVGLVMLLIAMAALMWRDSRRDVRRAGSRVAAAVPLFAVVILGFYSIYLGALWFSPRYLAPVVAVSTLALALAAGWCWRRRSMRLLLGLAVVLAGGTVGSVRQHIQLGRSPAATADVGIEGAKGYREAAAAILASVPSGAVVGSLQSGALSYYADRGISVVNLDGVVNRQAAEALRQRRLASYAQSRGVTYFADWAYNRYVLLEVSGRSARRAEFVPLARAKAQGRDVFTLWRVTWLTP